MEFTNKIISLLDVTYEDKLKNLNLEINKGEDVLIFSSNKKIPFCFKELLVFKNKNYSGVIKIGKNFLKKNFKDFWIPEKVLSIFSNKNKNHYFDKPLFEIMKYSFNTNEYDFKLMRDFRKDWKEVSDEYHFFIKEEEEKISYDLFETQIKIFDQFFKKINYKEFLQKLEQNNFNLSELNDYLDKRIDMLNTSLNNITYYEIKKFNVYEKYRDKYRKNEGKLQNLRTEFEIAEKEVESFEHSSEFEIASHNHFQEINQLKAELKKRNEFLKNGFLKNGIYYLLIKSLKLKIKETKKDLKEAYKSANKEQIVKAKINYWIKRKTLYIFKHNKKHLKYVKPSVVKGFYNTIKEFEIEFFNNLFFDFKRGKTIKLDNQLEIIEEYHEKKFTLNKIKILNEKKLLDTLIEKKELKKEINFLKKATIEGSKEIDQVEKHKKTNVLWEKKANYVWEKEKNENLLANSIEIKMQNNSKLEQEIINNIIAITKIDRFLFSFLKRKNENSNEVELEIFKKIKNVIFLNDHFYVIYHPISFLYTNDFEDNEIIQNVIIKNELYNFLKSINIGIDKLWIPYSDLTQEEKIKIDIGKLKLYSPEVALVDLNKTIFNKTYVDQLVANKNPNTSLIIFASDFVETKHIKNFVFIEKSRIIECSFNNIKKEFESEFAKKFYKFKSFDFSIIDKISEHEYDELYSSRRYFKSNRSEIYISDNELISSKILSHRQKPKKTPNFVKLEDTVIIDYTEEKSLENTE
ncbi:hypothetical protein [Mycoplasma sp. 5370]